MVEVRMADQHRAGGEVADRARLGVQFLLAGTEGSNIPFAVTNYSNAAPNILTDQLNAPNAAHPPVPQAARPPAAPGEPRSVDGVLITDMAAVGVEGSADFDSFEEMKVSGELFRQEAQGLQQGMVAGVKPLPIAIPESGKALAFAGVLPPNRVTLELDVKAKGKR